MKYKNQDEVIEELSIISTTINNSINQISQYLINNTCFIWDKPNYEYERYMRVIDLQDMKLQQKKILTIFRIYCPKLCLQRSRYYKNYSVVNDLKVTQGNIFRNITILLRTIEFLKDMILCEDIHFE